MPATCHHAIVSALCPPLRPGGEVLLHMPRSWNACPGCSLLRAVHHLQDTAWPRCQWTIWRPGIFDPLLSTFSASLLHVLSPYGYWSSFTMASLWGKGCTLVSFYPSCSNFSFSQTFPDFLQKLAQNTASVPRCPLRNSFTVFSSSSPVVLMPSMADSAFFLVDWLEGC